MLCFVHVICLVLSICTSHFFCLMQCYVLWLCYSPSLSFKLYNTYSKKVVWSSRICKFFIQCARVCNQARLCQTRAWPCHLKKCHSPKFWTQARPCLLVEPPKPQLRHNHAKIEHGRATWWCSHPKFLFLVLRIMQSLSVGEEE